MCHNSLSVGRSSEQEACDVADWDEITVSRVKFEVQDLGGDNDNRTDSIDRALKPLKQASLSYHRPRDHPLLSHCICFLHPYTWQHEFSLPLTANTQGLYYDTAVRGQLNHELWLSLN